MRTIPNRKITDNFSLYEFIEATLPAEAVALNWKHISEFREAEFIKLANFLQSLRNSINQQFRAENNGNEIGLRITSGFRCKAWERLRKRSGDSQHTIAAADVQPTNCSPQLAVKIMDHLCKKYHPRTTGHFGGFAIKRPDIENGRILRIGFLHYDLRGWTARWEY